MGRQEENGKTDIQILLDTIEFLRLNLHLIRRGATDDTPMHWVRSNLRSLIASATASENPKLGRVVERQKGQSG